MLLGGMKERLSLILIFMYIVGFLSIALIGAQSNQTNTSDNSYNGDSSTSGNNTENDDDFMNQTDKHDDTENETEIDDDFENETEVDDDTENEIEIMHNLHGKRMRLLQLEKAIYRRILEGEAIISFLKEKGKDTTNLEAIIEELKILKSEAETLRNSDNIRESVKKFIAIKKDAKSLVKKFRREIRKIIDVNLKRELKQRLREVRDEQKEKLKNLIEEIKNELKEIHKEEIKAFLEELGEVKPELLKKIENGEINRTEIKERLEKMLRLKDKRERERIKIKLKEKIAKEKLERRKKLLEYKKEAVKIKEEILKKRMEWIKKRAKFNNRIKELEREEKSIRDRISNIKAIDVKGAIQR